MPALPLTGNDAESGMFRTVWLLDMTSAIAVALHTVQISEAICQDLFTSANYQVHPSAAKVLLQGC